MTAVLAQAAEGAVQPSSAELVVFVVVGAVSLGSALAVVLLRNAVHAALMLVVNFFTIAVFYAVLEAQFLAVVQIIVYAGAIMVLFLFVIMLLGVDRELPTSDRIPAQKPLAVIFGLLLFVALTVGVARPYLSRDSACPSAADTVASGDTGLPCAGLAGANGDSNVAAVGALLFSPYVWPFEVTSVLLVIAAVGAMVMGRKSEDPRELVDRWAEEPAPAGAEPAPALPEAAPATPPPAATETSDVESAPSGTEAPPTEAPPTEPPPTQKEQ